MPGLGGRVIACLEARHASELADLITRYGGITYQAPCLREVHDPDAAETRLAVELICGDRLNSVIFLTGVGVQSIADGARRMQREREFIAGLARKRVAARGPKTVNALRRLGVEIHLIAPEPFTSDALLAPIEQDWSPTGETVLVQRYGAPAPVLCDGLRRLGVEVIEVSPYRWERPQDEEPVVRLIEDLSAGWIDVLAATSAAQVDQLFEIARQRGQAQSLRETLARPELRVAAQGIVCAAAFERRGVKVDLIPPRASMGSLVIEIANRADRPARDEHMPTSEGTVAVFAARDVGRAEIQRVLGSLGADATVAVLSGKSRMGDRVVEQACIERGLAVECFRPSRNAVHPADEMIRRATRVLIVTGNGRNLDVGRVLRLAGRYAKPVQVIDAPPTTS